MMLLQFEVWTGYALPRRRQQSENKHTLDPFLSAGVQTALMLMCSIHGDIHAPKVFDGLPAPGSQ